MIILSFFKKKNWLIFVLILVFVLLFASLSRGGNNPVSKGVHFVFVPIQNQFVKITGPVRQFLSDFGNMKLYKEENEKLKAENIELTSKIKPIKDYEAEIERLQKLLKIDEELSNCETVAAKVIAYEPDNWFSYITINRGTNHGISVSDVVVSSTGLLGQVTEAGNNWAKVSTIINSESSVGVRIVRNSEIGILEGDAKLSKTKKCKLGYLPANASVMEGDILETSGLGGIYPPGLKVGKLESVKNDNMGRLEYAVIEPYTNFNSLYEVLVITEWSAEPKYEDTPIENEENTNQTSQEPQTNSVG